MPALYLDTNIIIYASENSKNLYGKDLTNSSAKLLFDVVLCKHHVIISDWLLEEISGLKKLEQCKMIFKLIKQKTIRITYSEEDLLQAKKQNPDNFRDELHCILALKANADYIITRNISDFQHFTDIIRVVKPEKLI